MGASTLSADVKVDVILNLQFASSHEHKNKPHNGIFLKDLHSKLSDLLLTVLSFTSQLC